MGDIMSYVQMGLITVLIIGMIILLVVVLNVKKNLNKRIDELTSSTKTDLTTATTELKKKTTVFDHAEFDKMDSKLKELLVSNLSQGFVPKAMEALNVYITSNKLMGAIEEKLKSLNALSKEEILDSMQGLEGFTNFFRPFYSAKRV